MTTRRLALALIACLGALVAVTWAVVRPEAPEGPDLPALNDVVARLGEDRQALGQPGYSPPSLSGAPPYAVIGADGKTLVSTGPEAPANLAAALAARDTVIDLMDGDRVWGRVLFATGADAALAAEASRLRWAVTALAAVLGAVLLTLLWRIDRRVLRPFRQLDGFARQVAAGDLDAPLRRGRAQAFGAFTEAFDLMRQELAASRERERQADRAKKELVASLGHDMKTPVASIKAVAEVMAARSRDPKTAAQLTTITAKADQIDALATDLLEGALAELELLPVSAGEVSSRELARLVREADHLTWGDGIVLPDCLVLADPLRWAQTVGNIIANSYKYGRAPLRVSGRIDADRLEVVIADSGPGVPADELALVTGKFYRGAAGGGRDGAGLGLYLARHFMERMGGQLTCANANPGFAVSLRLRLA
ncbi:MAG: HAMP domain-containing histidine kinase [Bifidobacteriaceae bacterium]|nr:HAMP domain-containing histidine kinase [Bifidobacteriaceae bacterium]